MHVLLSSPPHRHYEDGYKCTNKPTEQCLKRKKDVTFLRTYNCEKNTHKSAVHEDKKKQIYRPAFVLAHFVHYSIVTLRATRSRQWASDRGFQWFRQSRENSKSERYAGEGDEAVMVHSRTVKPWDTLGDEWRGRPWPGNVRPEHASNSSTYNCFLNAKIEHHWLPLLEKEMALQQYAPEKK